MNLLSEWVPREEVQKHKIVKIQETLFQMQICTTIPPDLKHTINDALKAEKLHISGTTNGWQLDESIEPVKCIDFDNRWHYIFNC